MKVMFFRSEKLPYLHGKCKFERKKRATHVFRYSKRNFLFFFPSYARHLLGRVNRSLIFKNRLSILGVCTCIQFMQQSQKKKLPTCTNFANLPTDTSRYECRKKNHEPDILYLVGDWKRSKKMTIPLLLLLMMFIFLLKVRAR